MTISFKDVIILHRILDNPYPMNAERYEDTSFYPRKCKNKVKQNLFEIFSDNY